MSGFCNEIEQRDFMDSFQRDHEPESLSVTFVVTRADYERQIARSLSHGSGIKRPWHTLVMVIGVAAMVGYLVFPKSNPTLFGYAIFLTYALFACWLVFKVAVMLRSPVKTIVAQVLDTIDESTVLGPERITISPNGFRSDHGHLTMINAWPGVIEIVDAAEGISFKTGKTASYFVPSSAFESPAMKRAFIDRAVQWRNAAACFAKVCPECGYDLRGGQKYCCPECGWQREGASARTI